MGRNYKMKRFLGTLNTILVIICFLFILNMRYEVYAGSGVINITDSIVRTLEYDDQLSISEFVGEGYAIAQIKNETATSYQVQAGEVTENPDGAVITQKSGSKTNIAATGIGKATVVVVAKNNLDTVKKIIDGTYDGENVSIDAIQIEITVSPATLTLMFLAGQSNMQGFCSEKSGFHPEDSIVCTLGEVYSTYAPASDTSAKSITGLKRLGECTLTNIDEFVAGSLAADTDISGNSLIYSTDSLTSLCGGKTGPDSALAFEWNKLSGDKVWVINAASDDCSCKEWEKSASNYNRASKVFAKAIKTASAEIEAGHYIAGNRVMFWLQGENDETDVLTPDEYANSFVSMYEWFESELALDRFGIIPVRSSVKYVQYMIAMNERCSKLCISTNANEKWISDKSVEKYFSAQYKSGKVGYSLREQTTIEALPTKLEEIISGINYSQIAHNENGIDAARNMYYILHNDKAPSLETKITWQNAKGKKISELSLGVGQIALFEPVFSNVAGANDITYSVNSKAVRYDSKTGLIYAIKQGTARIDAKDKNGKVIAALKIKVKSMINPVVKAKNTSNAIELSWDKIDGATKYIVYRKNGKNKWKKIKESGNESYTDKKVKTGVTYEYKVKAYYEYVGKWSAGKVYKVCRLTPTSIRGAECTPKGIKLSWIKAKGAKGYYVYKKNSKGKWSKIATIKKGATLSYTDTKVSNGKVYEYKLIAFNGAHTSVEKISFYWAFLTAPSLKSLEVDKTNRATCSWTMNKKASGYQLEATTGTGTRIITTASNKMTNGQFYALGKSKKIRVRVRAYIADSNGVYYSAWSSAKIIDKK